MGTQYTITELNRKTGIARRTIHYYIKEKLIPPATGSGGGARYNDEHVIRLNLIKEMQKTHLKLYGIREALDGLSVSQMEDLYLRAKKGIPPWDTESLESWLDVDSNDPINPASPGAEGLSNYSFLDIDTQPRKESHNKGGSYLKDLKRSTLPDSSWKRFHVTDGIEINVRSEILENDEPRVMWWIKKLRSLFKQ